MRRVRHATIEDLAFLGRHDGHMPSARLERKIAERQVYVATGEGDAIVGWLRYGLFWDVVPFMNLLSVLECYRRQGIGRMLVEHWEEEMRHEGHNLAMTSSLANEDGQYFYRRLGYVDTGVLLLPGEPAELLFRKQLR